MNKRFVLLPLSLIAIFLTGCGKEDTSISSGNTTEPSSSENPSTDDDSSYGEEAKAFRKMLLPYISDVTLNGTYSIQETYSYGDPITIGGTSKTMFLADYYALNYQTDYNPIYGERQTVSHEYWKEGDKAVSYFLNYSTHLYTAKEEGDWSNYSNPFVLIRDNADFFAKATNDEGDTIYRMQVKGTSEKEDKTYALAKKCFSRIGIGAHDKFLDFSFVIKDEAISSFHVRASELQNSDGASSPDYEDITFTFDVTEKTNVAKQKPTNDGGDVLLKEALDYFKGTDVSYTIGAQIYNGTTLLYRLYGVYQDDLIFNAKISNNATAFSDDVTECGIAYRPNGENIAKRFVKGANGYTYSPNVNEEGKYIQTVDNITDDLPKLDGDNLAKLFKKGVGENVYVGTLRSYGFSPFAPLTEVATKGIVSYRIGETSLGSQENEKTIKLESVNNVMRVKEISFAGEDQEKIILSFDYTNNPDLPFDKTNLK